VYIRTGDTKRLPTSFWANDYTCKKVQIWPLKNGLYSNSTKSILQHLVNVSPKKPHTKNPKPEELEVVGQKLGTPFGPIGDCNLHVHHDSQLSMGDDGLVSWHLQLHFLFCPQPNYDPLLIDLHPKTAIYVFFFEGFTISHLATSGATSIPSSLYIKGF
jgi:hypothetical protein